MPRRLGGRIKSYLSALVGIEKIPTSAKPVVRHKPATSKVKGDQRCRRSIVRCEGERLSSADLTQQAAANAADLEKNVIQSKEELPRFLRNLTAPGEEFADIGESNRHKFALLDLGNKQCLVVALQAAMTSGVLGTTLARAKKAGFHIQKKCTVTFKVLDEINAEASQKNGAKGGDREATPEEQNRLLTLFVEIITSAIKKSASDIHVCIRQDAHTGLKSGAVLFRIDGKLYKEYSFDGETLLTMLSVAYLSRITTSDSRSDTSFNDREPQSCTMEYLSGTTVTRFRYHDTPCKDGMDAVMRVLSDDRSSRVGMSLLELGFEESQRKLLAMAASMPEGAIIVAGVTGCGKSTTLKTLIAFLRKKNPHKKYYTIEDPAEFKLFGVTQISIQRAEKDKKGGKGNGSDVNPFALATERLMRLDPDVIMSGEIRDYHSGSATKQLVQTGHQVFTTVHTKNAFQIPARLASTEIGMSRDTICAEGFLVAMIGQKLVPKLCPKCKVSAALVLAPEKLADIEKKYGIDPSLIKCRSEKGCLACDGRGSYGRTVCAEVWLPSREELSLLRVGKDDEAEYAYRAGRLTAYTDSDMTGKTTFEHALYKIGQGLVDPQDVEDVFGPFELLDTKIIKIKGDHESQGDGKAISIVDDQENDPLRAN